MTTKEEIISMLNRLSLRIWCQGGNKSPSGASWDKQDIQQAYLDAAAILEKDVKLYTEYFGTNHKTGEITQYPLLQALPAEKLLKALSLLNENACVYGVTYWIKVSETMQEVLESSE